MNGALISILVLLPVGLSLEMHFWRAQAASYALPTRRYPVQARPPFDNLRGELINAIEQCNFCDICAHQCPSQCLRVDKKKMTWSNHPFHCIFFGTCVDACPVKCLPHGQRCRPPSSEPQQIQLSGDAGAIKDDQRGG
jgi:ech hydrogenase subunit F